MALVFRQPSIDISANLFCLFVSSVVVNKILLFFSFLSLCDTSTWLYFIAFYIVSFSTVLSSRVNLVLKQMFSYPVRLVLIPGIVKNT